MIFESLWPLALLLSVPVVIILYLLKPRGKDYEISSTLLWDKLLKNQQSKTFLEKFIHNILMYLQILILLLLVFALMSPYIHREGTSRGNVILVLDTSGSMQHDAGDGQTRLEKVKKEVKSLIASAEQSTFSIVTNDCRGTELLAVGSSDKGSLYAALEQIECCDGAGSFKDAESVVDTLRGADEDGTTAQVLVFTDGIGAPEAAGFVEYFDARLIVMGESVSNVSNNFLSYVPEGDEYRFAASVTNYSDAAATMELGLYSGNRLLQMKKLTLMEGETSLCYFDVFDWDKSPLHSEISSVKFDGKSDRDSLAEDNLAYVVFDERAKVDAVLIGDGNTYIEKAYQAATGSSLPKTAHEQMTDVKGADDAKAAGEAVRIYDAKTADEQLASVSRMVFHDGTGMSEVRKNVMLTVSGCDLTAGISNFTIGVNETNVYEVPEWGTGFLWAGDACAGYYGEHDGVKVVVVGFDVRESDFPLTPEFPVFIANAVRFLGDTSLLADNIYEAGERVLFHPQADVDVSTLVADTKKAGLYEVAAGELQEQYVVRFAAGSQSDGRIVAQGTGDDQAYSRQLVKKQLRNVFLVLALVIMCVEWFIYVRQMRYRGKFYLAVRVVCVGMLLLALAGVAVNRRDAANTTIFLVDISNSNEQNLGAMEDFLDDTISRMPKENQYGIVTFGKNSLVEQFLTKERNYTGIMSLPDKNATNFEEAVSRALAMIPGGSAGRIVILTDGRQTRGDIAGTASALVARKVELLAKTYEVTQGQDAYIDNVQIPGYLYKGDAYTLSVAVESNYETAAQIQVWTGSIQTESYDVKLNRGTNAFKFRQTVTGDTAESFTVKVVAAGDTCVENNSYHTYAVVDTVPRVLLVSGLGENSANFQDILDSAGCNYDVVSAINVPQTLEGMLAYKSILLENVYLSDLPEGFVEHVETYVKDYGCGLICCGGDDSFALGGYRESVLETVLPVDMQLRGVDETPTTVMVMVIDHSGSMSADMGNGATSLDLAVQAAKTAVDQMRSTDYVGVVSFDDQYSWVVQPTLVSDRDAIKSKIDTIAEGGGTTIKPAVKAALDGALKCDAGIRHVVLLTDGQGEALDYSDVIAAYDAGDVTLSTVAVGDGSDTRLLKNLAQKCGGRYYYSDMASDIPKIFAQEVFLSGDTYLQNGNFALAVNGGNEITRGLFESGWPVLYGYVSATPKHSANVLIASEKDDPVLSVMQYGLGHTVAWNTDVTNMWTGAFAGQEDYVQLWKRIVDYSAGNAGIGDDSVNVVTAGGYTDISYTAVDYGEQTKVEAVYTDPQGSTHKADLQAVAPGRYEAKLDTDMSGVYNLSVRRIDSGEIENVLTTAAVVQYSDEYKFGVSTAAFTGFIDHYGQMLDDDTNLWRQRKSQTREQYELTKWLILFAILWFVMDIAFRRFYFRPQDTRLYRALRQRRQTGSVTRQMQEQSKVGTDSSSIVENDVTEAPVLENSGSGSRTPRKEKSRKDKKQKQEQTLDTSELLKKKNLR